jgi:hypothetical protein
MDKKKLAMMFNADDDDAPPFQVIPILNFTIARQQTPSVAKTTGRVQNGPLFPRCDSEIQAGEGT